MEFFGLGASQDNTIPVPNINLCSDIFGTKNYPLELLNPLNPLIPLTIPPVADEPSFSICCPWLKEMCLSVSRICDQPTVQLVGAGIAATGFAYFAWKLSMRWNSGVFSPRSDTETVKLDAEVEKIMSVAREGKSLSYTCSSCVDVGDTEAIRMASDATSLTGRLSRDRSCPCIDLDIPIKQLRSRVDLMMSRVEDVISRLKLLEGKKCLSEKEVGKCNDSSLKPRKEHCKESFEIIQPEPEHIIRRSSQKSGTESIHGEELIRKERFAFRGRADSTNYCNRETIQERSVSPEQHHQMSEMESSDIFKEKSLANIHHLIREIESRVDNMQVPKHSLKNKCESLPSSVCSDRWDRSSSFIVLSDENTPETIHPQPPTITACLSPQKLKATLYPPQDHTRTSPVKNQRRNTLSRNFSMTTFPPIKEDSFRYNEDELNGVGEIGETITVNGETKIQSKNPLKEGGELGEANYEIVHLGGVSLVQHQNQQREYTNHPKMNIQASRFKRSENSRFQVPKTQKDKNSTEDLQCQTNPHTEDSRFPGKSQHLTSEMSIMSEKNSSKKEELIFKRKSPCLELKHSTLMTNEPSPYSKNTEKNVSYVDLLAIPRNPSQPKTSHSDSNLKEGTEFRCQKHKLNFCDVDAPPKKISCRSHSNESLSSQQGEKGAECSSQQTQEPTPSEVTEIVPKNTSPIKQMIKRKNQYQVKYVNSKSGMKVEGSNPNERRPEKGDEDWIVIVPTED